MRTRNVDHKLQPVPFRLGEYGGNVPHLPPAPPDEKKFLSLPIPSKLFNHFSPRITAHEVAGTVDGSMTTKMTVQFNLFGGTMITLGTERHRKYLKGIDDMSVIGCFALTELGYGNNAVEMETTATYVSVFN